MALRVSGQNTDGAVDLSSHTQACPLFALPFSLIQVPHYRGNLFCLGFRHSLPSAQLFGQCLVAHPRRASNGRCSHAEEPNRRREQDFQVVPGQGDIPRHQDLAFLLPGTCRKHP
jgi:hypothetical protein